MAEFDFQPLKKLLADAAGQAFTALKQNHAGESFYCLGLYTSGGLSYLFPTGMTEEGLNRAVEKYQQKPRYANEPASKLRMELRWSPNDSPLHTEADSYFEAVNEVMSQVAKSLRSIDTDDDDWTEFSEFYGQVQAAICEVLQQLDQDGIFGQGAEREKVFVTIMLGDQDDSILDIGRRLNPPATVSQFEREWQALKDHYLK